MGAVHIKPRQNEVAKIKKDGWLSSELEKVGVGTQPNDHLGDD